MRREREREKDKERERERKIERMKEEHGKREMVERGRRNRS